ncbi:MAG: amidase [Acidobacteriota bacterium]|nr:amidase [Acidobacteriota bacterium]
MLDRRELFKTGAVGAMVAATTASGCIPRAGDSEKAGGEAQQDAIPGFELEEWTIAQLQEAMESGALTARSIAERYLERIAAIDHAGPELRSVLELNPEALEIADILDEQRASGTVLGPLHGIPILIKDNIDTHDRMTTSAGSLALEGTIAPEDSHVVKQLRRSGALILGKTNLSEWANFRSERSSSGWSGRGGQTRNPYALDRNPCGSSSGSGAAASASLAALAIGTETDGSVVCPSNANGIVGIKPTLGLVSRSGIVPIAHSQDTAGPMARTVRDAAILLGVMVGTDPKDAITRSASLGHADYTQFLDPAALAGARIGVWRGRFGFHERVDGVLEEGLAAMRAAGAEIIDPVEMPSIGEIGDSEYEVLLYEFKADLNKYLAARGADTTPRSLADLIAFNEAHADREMPYFQQEIFLKAEEKGPLTDKAYLEALVKSKKLSQVEGIDRVAAEHELDAIVAPTGGPAWVTDLVNGDHFGGGSSQAAAVSGYANVTVPAGTVFGLPVGMSFFGSAFSEPTLLGVAHAFEQATHARSVPRFLPTADLTL